MMLQPLNWSKDCVILVVCYMATSMMLSKTIGEIPNRPKGCFGKQDNKKKQHQQTILNETIVCLGFFVWGGGSKGEEKTKWKMMENRKDIYRTMKKIQKQQ